MPLFPPRWVFSALLFCYYFFCATSWRRHEFLMVFLVWKLTCQPLPKQMRFWRMHKNTTTNNTQTTQAGVGDWNVPLHVRCSGGPGPTPLSAIPHPFRLLLKVSAFGLSLKSRTTVVANACWSRDSRDFSCEACMTPYFVYLAAVVTQLLGAQNLFFLLWPPTTSMEKV